jgi:endonuclease/exonuclease/phosphatase family metal-dependent hydrolase
VIDLPSYEELETLLAGKKRGVRCDVAVGEKTFRIFGLHLSHRSENVREQSAKKVLQLVRSSPHPCVVMGDLNSTPPGFPKTSETSEGKNAIATFDGAAELHREKLELPLAVEARTYRSDKLEIVIDWIYLSRSLEFRSSRVVPSLLSDHRAVVTEFGWE